MAKKFNDKAIKRPNTKVAKKKKADPVISDFGEDNARPDPVTKKAEVPTSLVQVCGCGGANEDGVVVKLCPGCGWTWCNLCRRARMDCPICETVGVKT